MIKKIKLHNFQNHIDTTIDLKDGLNLIIGESRSGKSAIIKGLEWVLFNKFNKAYINNNILKLDGTIKAKKECYVEVEFDDGVIIKRGKTNLTNYYKINGEVFDNIGRDVPAVISSYINSDKNLMIQRQFDLPFLVFESGGNISKYFGNLFEFDDYINFNKKLKSLIKQNEQTINNNNEDLNSLRERIKGKNLFDLKNDAKNINLALEYINKLNRLKEYKEKYDELNKSISSILEHVEILKQKMPKYKSSDIRLLRLIIIMYKQMLLLRDKLNERDNITNININSIQMYMSVYNKLIKLQTLNKKLFNINQSINNLKERKKELLHGVNICPVCGSKI